MPRGPTRTWRLQAAGLLGAALLLATREADRAPLEYHEAYIVQTAQEMERRGEWVVPWFNGEPRLRKPPLSYWLAALSGRLRGEDEVLEPIDGRLPSALAGAGVVALVLMLGTRLYDRRTAVLAAVMTITSLGFYHYSHSARTDMLYAFWCTAGLAAFVAAWRAEEEERGGGRYSLLMWICFAFATLAKGPHVPAMFLLGIGVWAAIDRVPPRKLLGWLRPGAGFVLYLALSVPWWLVLDGRLGGDGLRGTQLGGSLLRLGPPAPDYLYRLPQLLVPWFLMAPVVLALEWRPRGGGRATRLLGAVVATTVLLFSLGSQQRMFYVLPLLAPSLLLIAAGALRVLRDRPASRLERLVTWSGVVTLALLATGLALLLTGFRPLSGLPPDTARRLAATLVGVLACGLLFLGGVRRGRPAESSVTAIALASALVFWTLGGPLSDWSKRRTTDPGLAREAARLSGGPVRTWSILPDLYVYYAGREVVELESAREVLRALDESPETGMLLIAREGELSRLPATVGVEVIERGATFKDPDVMLVRLTRRPSAADFAGTGPGRRPRSARHAP